MEHNRRNFNNLIYPNKMKKPLLRTPKTNREHFNNFNSSPYSNTNGSRNNKICFEHWRHAVCHRNNCQFIHKPLSKDEPLENVTSYFYYLVDNKAWNESFEIYKHILTEKAEEEKQRTSLRKLCIALIKNHCYILAFSLQSELRRLKVTDEVIFWNLLSNCHLLQADHKQLLEDFFNYLIMSDVKFNSSNMREAVDKLIMMCDRRIFWNFLLFAVKHDFNPSPLACNLAIEALSTEKFHVNWVLRMFLKSSKEDLFQIKRDNLIFLREVTQTFCIKQNVMKFDEFLKKNNIQLYDESNDALNGTLNIENVPQFERIWSQFLSNDIITENDYSTLLNRFVRNIEEAPANFESFYSFVNTRKLIEDPSNEYEMRNFFWFSQLGIELMVVCSKKKQFSEALRLFTFMMNLNIDILNHHKYNKNELVLIIIRICLKEKQDLTAVEFLKNCNDLRREDFQRLIDPNDSEKLNIISFIINLI